MKTLALLALLFTGCATSSFYSHGRKFADIRADLTDVSIHYAADGSIDFRATRMNHSVPTRAAGSVLGTAGTALSGAITAGAVFAK